MANLLFSGIYIAPVLKWESLDAARADAESMAASLFVSDLDLSQDAISQSAIIQDQVVDTSSNLSTYVNCLQEWLDDLNDCTQRYNTEFTRINAALQTCLNRVGFGDRIKAAGSDAAVGGAAGGAIGLACGKLPGGAIGGIFGGAGGLERLAPT